MASLRILIVDDTPDDRALVRHEVEALFPDAQVVEAGTYAEYEAAFDGPPLNLVVTDLDLKWGTGRDVLSRVHAIQPDCPVIMFTDSGNEMVAVDLMKAGLTDYIVKSPRQLPRLRASLKLAVERGEANARDTARQAELAAALAHEKVLVRELHHRVRNNLQLISSLLQLRAKTSSDEAAAQLNDLAGRMKALASVQSHIYETENLDRVDFRSVLGEMADSIVSIHGDGHIRLVRDFDGPLTLDVSRAMPLGLLCYEFFLNAVKHAWPLGTSGTLQLIMRTTSEPIEICIGDDGRGYEQDSAAVGLGSRLVRALAAEAKVEISVISRPNGGTRATLRLL